MPGLTAKSKVLAASLGCPRQFIAYNDWGYGFQCNLELTPELLELLIANDEEITVTGVQPKLSLNLTEEESKKKSKRFTIVGLLGNYILKPPAEKYPQVHPTYKRKI
jgi:GMP synthase-like glutamine amidotransferase